MYRWLTILILFLFSLNAVYAQEGAILRVLEKLGTYAENYPKEKVYLHLDKPYYAAGDNIWFKGYVTIGAYNNLSGLSKILYVDLINPDGQLVRSIRLPLISGVTMGDFKLADSLRGGSYRICAYTNWMRNFDSDGFFDRTLPVGNAPVHTTNTATNIADPQGSPMADGNARPITPSIQFFPESGHLVAGNLTKVGFQALRSQGVSIEAVGDLVDNTGMRIAEFQTTYAGMGSFSFIPRAGSAYTAKVTYADGSTAEQALPPVQASGYALAVNNELERQVFVQAFASDDLIKGQQLALLAQRNGTVFYASKGTVTKSELIFSIPREYLPAGVVQLTLLSPEMKPLAERAIFNMNEQLVLPLSLDTDQKIYGPREKVSVQITVGEETDSSRIAALSATVVDLAKVPIDSAIPEANIYASLLLSSDVKGYIEAHGYYVEDTDASKRRQLDNVMLTRGWNRINWQSLMAGKTPAITYPPEQDLRISGVVTKRGDQTPVPNATVTILSTGNVTALVDTLTDEQGRFTFDRLLFFDDTRFVVQARDERGRKNVDIQLDSSPRQEVTRNRNTPDATVDVNQAMNTFRKSTQEQFQEMEKYGLREKSILLQEVKVTRKTQTNNVKHSSNLNGPGNADQVLTAADLTTGCVSLADCLQGRLLGVVFRNGIAYSTRSINHLTVDHPMQLILDGMYMEPEALELINPFDVETIEVLRGGANTAIYGVRGGSGVLIITTKRGDGGEYNDDLYTPGIVTHSPQGYYEVREFYAPDYSKPIDSLADMRDFRTTIHWSPNVITDASGHASIEFYTADTPGTYRIVVEGLDVSGRLGRAVHYITIK